MKKQALVGAAVASVLLFGGCNNQAQNAQGGAGQAPKQTSSSSLLETKPSTENAVAVVNGKPITKDYFQSVKTEMAQRAGGQTIPEDKLLDSLISRELLRQEAEKLNLVKDPAVSARIDNAIRDVLIQADVDNFRKTAEITDEEIKKEYDTRVAAMKSTEYKARHILLDDEKAAKEVIAKLQKGAKFEDLAKKLSKDPSAKQNSGELGWFNPQGYVKEFSDAVAALKDGETTSSPVKSQFGWHVIQRQESREQAPPPFDAVKEQFRNLMLGQKLQKHVDELKTAAKIERFLPPAPTANPEEPPKPQGAAPANPQAPQTASETKAPPVSGAAKPATPRPAQ